MKVEEAIIHRRSIRRYISGRIKSCDVKKILRAAIWAPSGLNNQPWAFKIIRSVNLKNGLAKFTSYGSVITKADLVICVFLNKKATYNIEKDTMAIGACIQNMLIRAYGLGIGSCWLGEILNRRKRVQSYLEIHGSYKLMAVIAFGYPRSNPKGKRRKLERFILP
ncbi:MAG: nitroreductase family protein [Candidatus Omnitrophica bacterium]|nr:nitroreductase family protein [Candidatus Omnitrophota bacterium]